MPSISENIQRLLDQRGLYAKPVATAAGLGETAILDILAGRSKSPRFATISKIAAYFEVDVAEIVDGPQPELGAPVLPFEPASYSHSRDMPVYASAQGGPDGMVITYEPIDYIRRPDFLEHVRDAFAFHTIGDSMSPRFEHGERLLVHPKRAPGPGDDVLVIFIDGDRSEHLAIVKRLVGMNRGALTLRQFNPPKDFDIDKATTQSIFKIVGTQISD